MVFSVCFVHLFVCCLYCSGQSAVGGGGKSLTELLSVFVCGVGEE